MYERLLTNAISYQADISHCGMLFALRMDKRTRTTVREQSVFKIIIRGKKSSLKAYRLNHRCAVSCIEQMSYTIAVSICLFSIMKIYCVISSRFSEPERAYTKIFADITICSARIPCRRIAARWYKHHGTFSSQTANRRKCRQWYKAICDVQLAWLYSNGSKSDDVQPKHRDYCILSGVPCFP